MSSINHIQDNTRCASGCLFGLAFGDALAADTEFLSVAEILRRFPPDGPRDLNGNPAHVTDDTQMTLALGEALLQVSPPYTAQKVEPALRAAFVRWSQSPDNIYAPGVTCMQACARLAQGLPWPQATVTHSKGCGANMRVAPIGLLPSLDQQTRAALAQFQAALTHAHPTALTAADLTATAIYMLRTGTEPQSLSHWLRDYARSQRTTYYSSWLLNIWQVANTSSPQNYIAQGWDECLDALDRLDNALRNPDPDQDPCLTTGEGWIAEEALVTALHCFLLFPDDPLAMLRRAAVTSGDSDSIACLVGAFSGAYHGISAWPQPWFERIMYRDRLIRLANAWDNVL
jgi:ADP-ribosylglycohydrolase